MYLFVGSKILEARDPKLCDSAFKESPCSLFLFGYKVCSLIYGLDTMLPLMLALILTDLEEEIAVCLILEEVLVFTNIYVFHCPVDLDLCLKLLKIEARDDFTIPHAIAMNSMLFMPQFLLALWAVSTWRKDGIIKMIFLHCDLILLPMGKVFKC